MTPTDLSDAAISLKQDLSTWTDGIVNLYLEKRKQYGDSFTDSAIKFKHPEDSEKEAGLRLFLQREYDKLKRVHQTVNGKMKNDKDEGVIEDALKDIVGYVLVIRAFLQSQKS